MLSIVELFDLCANRKDYITVTPPNKKYEVDYKFIEDEDERVLYIFFEPSDGNTDWKVNFAYWRKPYKDMAVRYRVHGGFLESWKLIDDTIGTKIREVVKPEINEDGHWNWKWQKVVIVGYSHGGALAALCHEYVWYNRIDLRDGRLIGISFDGPRVFAGLSIPAALKQRWAHFYLICNQDDLVTHLPPVIFFFRHVGNKIKIGAKARPKVAVFKEWMGAYFKDTALFQELVGIKPHYPAEIRKGIVDIEDGRISGLNACAIKIEQIEENEKGD